MTFRDIISSLSLEIFCEAPLSEVDMKNVYVSDLLSDVMANCTEHSLWITLQTHMNIVAVALMKNIPAIIIANGRRPDDEIIEKAKSEGIALFGSPLHSFEIAGRLYTMIHSNE